MNDIFISNYSQSITYILKWVVLIISARKTQDYNIETFIFHVNTIEYEIDSKCHIAPGIFLKFKLEN